MEERNVGEVLKMLDDEIARLGKSIEANRVPGRVPSDAEVAEKLNSLSMSVSPTGDQGLSQLLSYARMAAIRLNAKCKQSEGVGTERDAELIAALRSKPYDRAAREAADRLEELISSGRNTRSR